MKLAAKKSKEWRENSDMKAVQVYLPPHLLERLEYACERADMSKSEIIRQLIRTIEAPDVYSRKAIVNG